MSLSAQYGTLNPRVVGLSPTLDANFVAGFTFTSHATMSANQQTTIDLLKTDFIVEFWTGCTIHR